MLLQKIIASERRNMPCVAAELKLEDLPCCAVPPFTLLSVQQSGIQPWWTPLDNQTNHQKLQLCISIPVCCRVRDACGKQYQATSVVEVDVSIRPPCPACAYAWVNAEAKLLFSKQSYRYQSKFIFYDLSLA
ncbi:MAG: hypothetical protein RR821_07705 [Clostridia bacterium]